MINLLSEKLAMVNELKFYTKNILSFSVKSDDEKISALVEERQKYIDNINLINSEIDNCLKTQFKSMSNETNEIKTIKNNIKESIQEIINMDKEIRKSVNDELKDLKIKLNQPDLASNSVNIKI